MGGLAGGWVGVCEILKNRRFRGVLGPEGLSPNREIGFGSVARREAVCARERDNIPNARPADTKFSSSSSFAYGSLFFTWVL